MATKRVIADNDFDKIVIRTHRLARNITMRTKGDGLYVTTPPRATTSKVLEVVDKFRQSLLESWRATKKDSIAPGFVIMHHVLNCLWLKEIILVLRSSTKMRKQ